MNKLFAFLKTPKGLIIAALVVLVIVIIISYNWNTIKGWFSSSSVSASRNITTPPNTYCFPSAAACLPVICYKNGQWYHTSDCRGGTQYVLDTANSASGKCCYKKSINT